jgi:small GTP-binding protein
MGVSRGFKLAFYRLLKKRIDVKLGIYGPTNVGKTTLANRITRDWVGDDMGSVSEIPHETRQILKMERMEVADGWKKFRIDLIDTPGIETKVDYREFMKYGLSEAEAKRRAKEATQGVLDSIKWLANLDAVLVVMDSTIDPYTQVNITILGNLEARSIPTLIVANKIDLPTSDPERIRKAFPAKKFVSISAKDGDNVEKLYESVFDMVMS